MEVDKNWFKIKLAYKKRISLYLLWTVQKVNTFKPRSLTQSIVDNSAMEWE